MLLAFVLLAGAIYRQQFATFKTLAVQFATSLSPVSVPPLLWRTDALQASFQRTTSLRSLVVNQTAASAAAANCLLRSTLSCVPNWRARARAIERAADGRGRREGRKEGSRRSIFAADARRVLQSNSGFTTLYFHKIPLSASI